MGEGTPTETWRPVVGYEGLYEVSDLGRVWSRISGKMLKPLVSDGYEHVTLSWLPGQERRNQQSVHTLVLEAFDRPRPPGHEAMHGPGGHRDNRPCNLAWGTISQNRRRPERFPELWPEYWPNFEPR